MPNWLRHGSSNLRISQWIALRETSVVPAERDRKFDLGISNRRSWPRPLKSPLRGSDGRDSLLVRMEQEDQGDDVHAVNNEGPTPSDSAARLGHEDVAGLLKAAEAPQ